MRLVATLRDEVNVLFDDKSLFVEIETLIDDCGCVVDDIVFNSDITDVDYNVIKLSEQEQKDFVDTVIYQIETTKYDGLDFGPSYESLYARYGARCDYV